METLTLLPARQELKRKSKGKDVSSQCNCVGPAVGRWKLKGKQQGMPHTRILYFISQTMIWITDCHRYITNTLYLVPVFVRIKPINTTLFLLIKWSTEFNAMRRMSHTKLQIPFCLQEPQDFHNFLPVIHRPKPPSNFRLRNNVFIRGNICVNKNFTWLIPGRNITEPMTARKAACQKLGTLFPLMSSQRRGNRLVMGSLVTMTLHFVIK